MKPTLFIGSGEASRLERKTLIYSIRKNASSEVDIYVFNGTHDTLEKDGEPPRRLGMSLAAKYMNVTEFSNYRFLIPGIMGNAGMAAFVDSDMICLGDVAELFRTPMEGFQFRCKPDAYGGGGAQRWGLSVTLMDCAAARFDLDVYAEEIGSGKYSYTDLHQMSEGFLKHHPFRIGPLDPKWNEFDQHDQNTKLIHYTNLRTQPWKYPNHPAGDLWFRYFKEAREAGYITKQDIDITLNRAYCRDTILDGNWAAPGIKGALRDLKSALKRRVVGRKVGGA